MQQVAEVEAITGAGLKGDRYSTGEGSWNKEKPGRRQVTIIEEVAFIRTGFNFAESRRNIVTSAIKLVKLTGREFTIGTARFRGLKYCEPCDRPSVLCGKKDFKSLFEKRGGLVAEVIQDGLIRAGDPIVRLAYDNSPVSDR